MRRAASDASSGKSPMRSARSKFSPIRSTRRGDRSISSEIAGCRAMKSASNWPSTMLAKSPGIDTRKRPLGSTCRCCASDAAASTSLATWRACSSTLWPKSVTVSLRVVRSSSRSPSCDSSAATRRETVDFGSRTRVAARLKLPSSTTRANSIRSFGSRFMIVRLSHQWNNVIRFMVFRNGFGTTKFASSSTHPRPR